MGGLLFKAIRPGVRQKEYYIKFYPDEDGLEEKMLRQRRPTRMTKLGRGAKFVLYDMKDLRAVDDHEAVRKLLLRIPEWVPQTPRDGYIEYWFYFGRDGEPLTPSMQLYPAARARLPWPHLKNASRGMLLSFVHVVNRIAHCQLLSLQSTMDIMPLRRQEKQHFSNKIPGRTKRLHRLDQSMKRGKSWRPMSLVKSAYYKIWNRSRGKC